MIREGVMLSKRYEVLERIGTGGMAEVYRGKDHKLNRYIAIKVLKREYREDDDFVKKFQKEAQSAAGLMHPNVVNVYDVGVDRGLYYMVMELVEGITLKDYIEKKGHLSPTEVIGIGIQICSGIDAAHQKGIIHRDIKPQNVLISKDGKAKVTDFGIAKAVTSETVNTTVMGSVHYTSPEQARGGFSDVKSDIYSTGITLFEMATGHVPFDGDSTVSVAVKHLQEEMPYPSEYVPDIPQALEDIIMKCTKKSSVLRYEDMSALITDMKKALMNPDGNFVDRETRARGETVMLTRREKTPIPDDDDEDDIDDDNFPEEGEVNSGMTKIMKIMTIVVAVIIAFVLLFVVAKATGIFKIGAGNPKTSDETAQVTVPDITGKTEEEGKAALKEVGLGYKYGGEKESEKYEKGLIVEQSEKAGSKVDKNTRVTVYISSGKKVEKITVPGVEGSTPESAEATLKAAGFTNITKEEKESDSVDEGKVIGTNPAEGASVAADTQITIQVSKGVANGVIPDVTGLTQEDATSALQAAGFTKIAVSSKESDSVGVGEVISTNPTGGTTAAKSSTVTIYVSKGTTSVTVPNLVGKSQSQAEQALSALGLGGNASSEYSNETKGTVIYQDPGAGASVKPGSTVSYTVSKGPEPKEQSSVPYVVGMSESEAKSAITGAGLAYGGISGYANSDSVEKGNVISVSIPEGSTVDAGTTVTIVISLGPEGSTNTSWEDDWNNIWGRH